MEKTEQTQSLADLMEDILESLLQKKESVRIKANGKEYYIQKVVEGDRK